MSTPSAAAITTAQPAAVTRPRRRPACQTRAGRRAERDVIALAEVDGRHDEESGEYTDGDCGARRNPFLDQRLQRPEDRDGGGGDQDGYPDDEGRIERQAESRSAHVRETQDGIERRIELHEVMEIATA